MLRWYIASAAQAARLLSPGDSPGIDVPPVEGPEPAVFEDAAAAFEWFDTERPNLVASTRAALESGLPRRAWELATVLTPIQAQHFTFDDWSALSELGSPPLKHWLTQPRSLPRWTTEGGFCSGAEYSTRPRQLMPGRLPSARKWATSRASAGR